MADNRPLPPNWAGRKFKGREYAGILVMLAVLAVMTFPAQTLSSDRLFTRPWLDSLPSEFAFYPWDQFLSERVKSGEIPIWNPLEAGGNPFLANYQSSVFYPLKLLVILFGAMDFFLLLRLVVAGLFMYRFCRFLRISSLGSILGTLAFTLNSYFLFYLNQPHVNAEVLIPMVLFTTASFIRFGGAWRFLAASLSVAMVVFGGHPEATFYVLLFCSGFSVFEGWVSGKGRVKIPLARRILGGPLIHACGVTLGAVQILPFLEYLGHAWHIHAPGVGGVHRDALGFVEFVVPHLQSDVYDFPMGVGCVTLFIALHAVCGIRRLRARAVFFALTSLLFIGLFLGVWPFIEMGRLPFIGEAGNIKYPAPIVIASLSVLAAMGLDRLRILTMRKGALRGVHLLGAGLIVLGFVIPIVLRVLVTDLERKLDTGACALALGMIGGIMVFIHLRQKGAIGSRSLPLTILAYSLAALWSSHARLGGSTGWWLAALALAGPVLAAGHITWIGPISRARVLAPALMLLTGVTCVHLMKDGVAAPPVETRELPDPESPPDFVARILQENQAMGAGPFRIMGEPFALPANQATVYGLEDVRSFDALYVDRFFQFLNVINELPDYRKVFLPLPPRISLHEALKRLMQTKCDWRFFEKTKRSGIKLDKFTDPLVDLLGVRFFLYSPKYFEPEYPFARGRIPAGPGYRVIYNRDGYCVVANDGALPRAFLVHSADVRSSVDGVKALLGNADFKDRVRDKVVLESAPGGSLPGTGRQAPDEAVRIRSWGTHHLHVDVVAKAPAILVVTDNFYPGWVATLYREDAEEVTLDIMPADLAFRGVYLPAGTHTVHFSYRPRSVLYGAVLGGVLLLLLLSICLVPPCRSLLSRRAVPGYADSGGG